MDTAWEKAAAHYGFLCRGCGDNCCESEFYHHSFIEKDYFLAGLGKMTAEQRKTIKTLAREVRDARRQSRDSGRLPRIMCPVNADGLCALYHYRPMICRLHGIPHELAKPGSLPVRSPGCPAGTPLFEQADYFIFDRTPFYTAMAALETDYRQAIGKSQKIRLSIAEMIVGTGSDRLS